MSDTWDPQDPILQMLMQQYALQGNPSQMFGAPTFTLPQFENMYGLIPMNEDQLDFNRDSANYLQDVADITMDPFIFMQAGLSGLSPDALAPQVSYEVIDRPGLRAMESFLARPETFEGMIAAEILQRGGSALTAVGKMQQLLEEQPDSPEAQALARQLPVFYDDLGTLQIDWTEAQNRADAMQQTYLEDPQVGTTGAVYDPETGALVQGGAERQIMLDEFGNPQLVEVRTEEAPMAEWLRKNGLSSPYDEYTPEDLLGNEWVAQGQQLADDWAQYEQAYQQFSRELDLQQNVLPEIQADLAATTDWLPRDSQGNVIYNAGDRPASTFEWSNPETAATGSTALGGPDPWNGGGGTVQRQRDPLMQRMVEGLMGLAPAGEPLQDEAGMPQAISYDPLEGAGLPAAPVQSQDRSQAVEGPVDLDAMVREYVARQASQPANLPVSGEPAGTNAQRDQANQQPVNSPFLAPQPQLTLQQYVDQRDGSGQSEGVMESMIRFMTGGQQGPMGFRSRPEPEGEGKRTSGFRLPTSGEPRGTGAQRDQQPTLRATNRNRRRSTGVERRRSPGADRREELVRERTRVVQANYAHYGEDYGRAVANAMALAEQGVTPFQQQMLARRMVPMAMGLQGSGGYAPGM